MNKKIIIIISIIIVCAASSYGIYRYRKHAYAERLRKEQAEQREKREQERKENLKNGVEPTEQLRVPDLTGMTVKEAMGKLEEQGFKRYYYSIEEVDSSMDEGLIVKFTPGHGTSHYENSTVMFVFYVSNGNK